MAVTATLCPYCREPLLAKEETRNCEMCGTLEHCACWQEYNRCSVYGCPGKPSPAFRFHHVWKMIPALIMLFASHDGIAFATFAPFYLTGILFCISQAFANASILMGTRPAVCSRYDEMIAVVKILLNVTAILVLVRTFFA